MNTSRTPHPPSPNPSRTASVWLKSIVVATCTVGALLAWGQADPTPSRVSAPTEIPTPTPAPAPAPAPAVASAAGHGDGRLTSQALPLDGAIPLVKRLRPKRFLQHTGHLDSQGRTVLDPNPTPSVGLIAQESAQVVPEAVYRPLDDSKEFWEIDQEKLVPVLVRAIQEQESEIRSQSSRIQSLESQVSSLESQMGSLSEDLRKLKEFTQMIDQAARGAFGDVRSRISDLKSKVDTAVGKTECTCSK